MEILILILNFVNEAGQHAIELLAVSPRVAELKLINNNNNKYY